MTPLPSIMAPSTQTPRPLPPASAMYEAMLAHDPSYEGIFIVAVKTTGIFCRPVCPARKPKRENVEFFADVRQAMLHGYRPCKRCRPLEPAGDSPGWLRPVLDEVAAMPVPRLPDRELAARGIHPARVRRWFQREHGMTFQAWLRALRVSRAMDSIRRGHSVTASAFDAGYESLSGFAHAWTSHITSEPRRSSSSSIITLDRVTSPLGPLLAGVIDGELCLLDFVDRRALNRQIAALRRHLRADLLPGKHPLFARLQAELDEYFAGRRQSFSLPIRLAGTPFQRDAWEALLAVPYQQTRSYRQQADAIGKPAAARAVGRANGANRLAIIVPCHRIVGEDGALTGYGGGLERKRYLLEHERRVRATLEHTPDSE